MWHLRQQTAEFVLAVCQSLRPQVLAVSHQQIEREEARLTPVKEQVIELRLASFVETDNFSVEHCLPLIGRCQCLTKIRK